MLKYMNGEPYTVPVTFKTVEPYGLVAVLPNEYEAETFAEEVARIPVEDRVLLCCGGFLNGVVLSVNV